MVAICLHVYVCLCLSVLANVPQYVCVCVFAIFSYLYARMIWYRMNFMRKGI